MVHCYVVMMIVIIYLDLHTMVKSRQTPPKIMLIVFVFFEISNRNLKIT